MTADLYSETFDHWRGDGKRDGGEGRRRRGDT